MGYSAMTVTIVLAIKEFNYTTYSFVAKYNRITCIIMYTVTFIEMYTLRFEV